MALVEGWLRGTGLEVFREPFTYDVRPAFRALRLLLIGAATLLLVAGLLATARPGVAAAVLVVTFGAGGMFLGWAPWLERIYAREAIKQSRDRAASWASSALWPDTPARRMGSR